MARKKYILVRQYCHHSKINVEFVENLYEFGLVNYEMNENEFYIDEIDIINIEKLFRLYTDLGINFEGLGAIKQMLKRLNKMEIEIKNLRERLYIYE